MFFHQMLKIIQILLVVIAIFLTVPFAQAKDEIPSYNIEQEEHLIVNYLYRLLDKPYQHSFEQKTDLTNNKWEAINLNNGDILIMPGENWFVFKLLNKQDASKQVYFDMANQIRMDNVELFISDGDINKKEMPLQRSNNRLVKIIIDPNSEAIFYLTITSSTQLRSTLNIYSTEKYIEANSILQFQHGFSIGGLLCLSIAFILLFFATGNKTILILTGYFLTNALMLSAMLGVNLYYFFPEKLRLIGIELPLLSAISAIFLLIFTSQLFSLKTKFFKIYKVNQFAFWWLLLYIPLSSQLSIINNVSISMLIYVFVVLSLIIIGLYLYKNSARLALLFTFVMTIQLILVLIVIVSVNWFDIGFIANRSPFYGVLFWLNCLLLTFLLSRQYRYQLLDKQEAQRQALISVENNERAQEELLKLQSQSQEELENRVQERTLELNIALQELEEVNQVLEEKNTQDELTGLFNRRCYDQKILAEYRRSKRNLTPLSLVIIDIDHFKDVNDTHGHLAGDHCIVWLSNHIKKSLKRSSDMAFRYGGEEFCLILPDTDAKGAMTLAEELRNRIAKQVCTYKEVSFPLTISNGIFTYVQQDNVLPEQIFSSADKALYQAKHDGRNQTKACPD